MPPVATAGSARRRRGRGALVAVVAVVAVVLVVGLLAPPVGPPPPPPAGCAGAGESRIPFLPDRVLPPCRIAGGGSAAIVDRPLPAALGPVKQYDRLGSGYNGGKAKVFLSGFDAAVTATTPVPLEDSFAVPFATVIQRAPGCFAFSLGGRPGGGPDNCPRGGDRSRREAQRLRIEIVAVPCMARPSDVFARDARGRLEPASYLVDFVPAPGDRGIPPAGTGTFAIVAARYLAPSRAAIALIMAAYPGNVARDGTSLGCGRPSDFQAPSRTPQPMTALRPAPSTAPPPGAPRAAAGLTAANSIYLNQRNYADCRSRPPAPCHLDSYLNYYLSWAPSVRYLLSSTTEVSSASVAHPQGHPPSGVIRAVVQDVPGRYVRVYGSLAYSDPNVPCAQQRTARWVFADANPTDPNPDGHIFGWLLTYDYQPGSAC